MRSRILWVLPVVLAAVAVVLVVTPGQSRPSKAVRHGEALFLNNCAACHNALHKVGPPMVKDVGYFVQAGVPAQVLGGMLTHAVRQRPEQSVMPTFTPTELSDADLQDIALYLTAQTPAPKTPLAMGSAEAGAPLYAANCAKCHGAQGEGPGRAPAVAGIANEMKQATMPPSVMVGYVLLATRSGSLPHMPTFAPEKLSDAQLADIAAFIWALPPPAPKGGEAPR